MVLSCLEGGARLVKCQDGVAQGHSCCRQLAAVQEDPEDSAVRNSVLFCSTSHAATMASLAVTLVAAALAARMGSPAVLITHYSDAQVRTKS